jgi:hypothetical protein
MDLEDWWHDTFVEAPWLKQLDKQVKAQGLGKHRSRCFMAHRHLRRRTAKRMFALALAAALLRFSSGWGEFGLWLGLVFSLVPLPHEALGIAPPSRIFDIAQAALFLILPPGLLELGGGPQSTATFAGIAEVSVLPLAAGATMLLLVDSWCFTREIWYTCRDGLVAVNGRGRIRKAFAWSEIRKHRVETALRMAHPWFTSDSGGPHVSSLTDEWWLTLADGSTEHLFLHQGSAIESNYAADPLMTHATGEVDPLTRSLSINTANAHVAAARAELADGATVSFGPRITATEQGCRIDGLSISWYGLAGARPAWGRRRLGGLWWRAPVRPRWRSRSRSMIVINVHGRKKKLYVPTREIENFFLLRKLRYGR